MEPEPPQVVSTQDPDSAETRPSPFPAPGQSPDRLRSLFQLVGSVVAPTTLLTALLFYFGWAHAYWFFRHFGLDITLLGLTTQDFLMRSVDALFVPLTVLLSVGLVLLWAHSRMALFFAGPAARSRLRRSAIAVTIAGLILFGIGMAGILVRALQETYHVALPLSLGTGTLLLLFASRLHRRSDAPAVAAAGMRSTPLLEATGAFLLVALSLFWAATNYAADVGCTRARQYEGRFRTEPEAILYSKERLRLEAPGVQEVSCAQPEGGYRFRYEGLRLMLRSAGQYFFLPESWSPSDGVAIIVPEGDSVRLEFAVSPREDPRPTTEVRC